MPANLQGIWADGLTPPWNADYGININIKMNYWPAEVTNLSKMHMPFLNFLDKLRQDGRKTAQDMYGLKGTIAHFTTDAWHFTGPYGQTHGELKQANTCGIVRSYSICIENLPHQDPGTHARCELSEEFL